MLTIFKRHTKACKAAYAKNGVPRDMGRDYRKCTCPLHTEGTLGGESIRKALDTNSWTRAQAIVRDKEAAGRWDEPKALVKPLVADCVRVFLSSLTSSSAGRCKSTIRGMRSCLDSADANYASQLKTRTTNEGLAEYCALQGVTYLEDVTLPFLTTWAASWTSGPLHRAKRIQLLRRFFKYCIAAKWTDTNPAMAMEYPKGKAISSKPKVPYDASCLPAPGPEWNAINSYCATRPALRALVYLMRYAGLRISDAANFNTSKIMSDGSIHLSMAKTGDVVTMPMHPAIKEALSFLTPNASGYYFASGGAASTTATDNWRCRLVKMFKACEITKGHAHRFRHTFAVDLLLRGVALDQVQALLGHASVKVTQKHYLPFVAARRAQLRDSLYLAWSLPITTPATAAVSLGVN